ncbi:MAG: hypothetical protein ACLT9P_07895 [Evtepia gabavorous]
MQKKYFFLFLLFKIFIETGELPERDKTRQASLWIIARTGKDAPKEPAAISHIAAGPFLKREKRERKESV